MNRLIVEGARRGEQLTGGALARLFGEPPVSESRRERLDTLEAQRQEAMRRGDDTALGLIEHNLERLFEEARAARTERPRDEQGRFTASAGGDESVSFDGGYRGRQPPPSPGMVAPTSTQLMAAAFAASRQERLEREADVKLVAGNF
jgi:hypothetical protein